MNKSDFKDGDEVIVSWKEDEGNGGYSNKRQKKGVVRIGTKGEFWVETLINPIVLWNDITAIKKVVL